MILSVVLAGADKVLCALVHSIVSCPIICGSMVALRWQSACRAVEVLLRAFSCMECSLQPVLVNSIEKLVA